MNIGNPDEFTIRQLAELVHTRGSIPLCLWLRNRCPRMTQYSASPSWLYEQLKWQPTVSLEHGLNPTIESFRRSWDFEISLRRDDSTHLLHWCWVCRWPNHGGDR